MSGFLPSMVYSDGIRKHRQIQFGGYDHRIGQGDGSIWDMKNMSSELYPVISPRRGRYTVGTLTQPNGLFCRDGMYWVDGVGFYRNGVRLGNVQNSKKIFAAIGSYILMFPDGRFYDTDTGKFGYLASKIENKSVVLQNGTYAGEEAAANTIYAKGMAWNEYFREGDGIFISGCVNHPENNKSVIIREIDGEYLRFYENTFVISEGGDTETILLERSIPEMDFVIESENRIWGCKGDTVYASKLGDPFNFNVFDGLSTDSFAVDVGSAGDFTGAIRFLGYPCFFKEDNIYKVYGDKPSNFQLMGAATLGVADGSGKSLAVAGEVLFYLSRAGIAAYSGGIPRIISAPFGLERYRNAVAGSDGVKYYVSMQNSRGTYEMFVYDTEKAMWHKEDETQAMDFGWDQALYFLRADGTILAVGDERNIPAGAVYEGIPESMVEFGDFTEDDPNKKGVVKLQMRCELDADAEVTIFMQFDSSGVWEPVKTLTTTVKRSFYIPILPRRCDHFKIKMEAKGGWRLYSLVRESYSGSEM